MAGGQRERRSVPAGPPSNLKPMSCEAQNLLHGGSHAVQCRGILSLIDTSRAGRTTLGMHLGSCEHDAACKAEGPLHIIAIAIESDWPICASLSNAALDLRALTGLGASWGRFVQGATGHRPHGDPESMEIPRQSWRHLGLG